MLSVHQLSARHPRSALAVLSPLVVRAILLNTRIGAAAVFFCSFSLFFLFLGLALALGFRWLVALRSFPQPIAMARRFRRPLSYGDVGCRDFGHGLDAFGVLRELPIQT